MTDREKVIKGLEICSAGKEHAPNDRDCTSCPYYPAGYTGCTCKSLMTDVLVLLKEQEPRVMTWEDVIGAVIECKPIYIEVKDSEDKESGEDRWAMVTQYGDSLTNGMICAMSSYITRETLFKDWYNKTWRCWTSKPSLKQMEETPWK